MTPAHRRAPASPGRLALVLAGCAALGVAVAYLLQPSAPRPVAGAPGDVLPRVEPLPDYTPPPAPPRASTPPRKPSAPAPAASTPAPKPRPKPVRKRTAPPPAAPKPSSAKPEQPAKTTVKPQVKPPAAPKKAPVAPAPPPADADGLMPDERAVKLINLAREAHYLPSLTYDSGALNERAVSDAWHLSKGRRSFAFGGVRTRGAATADEAVRDLLLSHTTRPELLSSLHTRIGVGYVADGSCWSFHFS